MGEVVACRVFPRIDPALYHRSLAGCVRAALCVEPSDAIVSGGAGLSASVTCPLDCLGQLARAVDCPVKAHRFPLIRIIGLSGARCVIIIYDCESNEMFAFLLSTATRNLFMSTECLDDVSECEVNTMP